MKGRAIETVNPLNPLNPPQLLSTIFNPLQPSSTPSTPSTIFNQLKLSFNYPQPSSTILNYPQPSSTLSTLLQPVQPVFNHFYFSGEAFQKNKGSVVFFNIGFYHQVFFFIGYKIIQFVFV